MELKDNIKRRRLDLGLTLEELANKIEVSRSTLHKYENGVIANIPHEKIEKLAKALKTIPVELVWNDFYISEKSFKKENTFYDYLYLYGYTIEAHDNHIYYITHNKKTYAVSIDEMNSLLKSSTEYTEFLMSRLLKSSPLVNE